MLSTLQMLDVLNPPVLKEMGNYLEDEWLNSEHVCLPFYSVTFVMLLLPVSNTVDGLPQPIIPT